MVTTLTQQARHSQRFLDPRPSMSKETVWVVFHRAAQGEPRRLSAICASMEAAQQVVALAREEVLALGHSGAMWEIRPWTVIDSVELTGLEDLPRPVRQDHLTAE